MLVLVAAFFLLIDTVIISNLIIHRSAHQPRNPFGSTQGGSSHPASSPQCTSTTVIRRTVTLDITITTTPLCTDIDLKESPQTHPIHPPNSGIAPYSSPHRSLATPMHSSLASDHGAHESYQALSYPMHSSSYAKESHSSGSSRQPPVASSDFPSSKTPCYAPWPMSSETLVSSVPLSSYRATLHPSPSPSYEAPAHLGYSLDYDEASSTSNDDTPIDSSTVSHQQSHDSHPAYGMSVYNAHSSATAAARSSTETTPGYISLRQDYVFSQPIQTVVQPHDNNNDRLLSSMIVPSKTSSAEDTTAPTPITSIQSSSYSQQTFGAHDSASTGSQTYGHCLSVFILMIATTLLV